MKRKIDLEKWPYKLFHSNVYGHDIWSPIFKDDMNQTVRIYTDENAAIAEVMRLNAEWERRNTK